MNDHPGFQPLETAPLLAQTRAATDLTAAAALCSGGTQGTRYLRLWPSHHGTDGLFAAIWQRQA